MIVFTRNKTYNGIHWILIKFIWPKAWAKWYGQTIKINPDTNAALESPTRYLTSKKALNPDKIKLRIHIILYAPINPKASWSGIDTIALSGVIVDEARLTPFG